MRCPPVLCRTVLGSFAALAACNGRKTRSNAIPIMLTAREVSPLAPSIGQLMSGRVNRCNAVERGDDAGRQSKSEADSEARAMRFEIKRPPRTNRHNPGEDGMGRRRVERVGSEVPRCHHSSRVLSTCLSPPPLELAENGCEPRTTTFG